MFKKILNTAISSMRLMFFISIMFLSDLAMAQAYVTYYNNQNVSGKIVVKNTIENYKSVKVNTLRFYNNNQVPCTITGWVNIRYTELSTGKTDFKEKQFRLEVPRLYDSSVNCYFRPSWSRYGGVYEPIGFFVDSIVLQEPYTPATTEISSKQSSRTTSVEQEYEVVSSIRELATKEWKVKKNTYGFTMRKGIVSYACKFYSGEIVTIHYWKEVNGVKYGCTMRLANDGESYLYLRESDLTK